MINDFNCEVTKDGIIAERHTGQHHETYKISGDSVSYVAEGDNFEALISAFGQKSEVLNADGEHVDTVSTRSGRKLAREIIEVVESSGSELSRDQQICIDEVKAKTKPTFLGIRR
jgi:hypothetical protein